MKRMKPVYLSFISIWVVFGLFSCSKPKPVPLPINKISNTLSEVIRSNYILSYYDTALLKNHLTDTLAGSTVYTVFAPINEGFPTFNGIFNSLDNYFYTNIQNGTNPFLYNRFTQYTIVPGSHPFSSFPIGYNTPLRTLEGDYIFVSKVIHNGDTIFSVNGSNIVAKDLPATNGLVHGVQDALNPAPNQNLYNVITGNQPLSLSGDSSSISLFSYLIQITGYSDSLKNGGPFTVFAPINDAFTFDQPYINGGARISFDDFLLSPRDTLIKFVGQHIIRQPHFLNEYLTELNVGDNLQVQTINHLPLKIVYATDSFNGTNFIGVVGRGNYEVDFFSGKLKPAPVTINLSNVVTNNGVIHLLDNFLKL